MNMGTLHLSNPALSYRRCVIFMWFINDKTWPIGRAVKRLSLEKEGLRYKPIARAKERGGREVQWSRGSLTLGGPWASGRPLASAGSAEGPWAREGPIEMTRRNQHVRLEDLFFWDHLILTGETVRISVQTFFFRDHLFSTRKTVGILVKTFFFFFFGDHIIVRTKLRHFLRLFWSLQNRKSVIFELAQGPHVRLSAPLPMAG